MEGQHRPGPVHWIDHYVVNTNDAVRWEAFHTELLGARTVQEPIELRRSRGIFQDLTRCRHGGFIAKTPLPPTRGLGKGLPCYGHYVLASDIDFHLRRLDKLGALHSDPFRTCAEGEDGIAIYWQDPDGNQFEFWAPDRLPEGAMIDCGPERIGRISHGIFESRDLDRTAAFFERYCALTPLRNDDIVSHLLVLPLAAGGRLVFRKVDTLEGRTTGCGLPDAHTALLVHDDDFLSNYLRMWAELPEWDFDLRAGKPIEHPETLAARTVLHVSPAGRKFKSTTGRGDDWFDWDTNMFHFYGGTPIGRSLAVYDSHPVEFYLDQWERTPGCIESLRALVRV